MSTLTVTRGDADQVPAIVDISDILPDTLAKAWFTVKRRTVDSDAQAVIQKVITPTPSADGQIDNVGSASPLTSATMYFLLTADETAALSDKVLYYYSIKALSLGGAPKTIESGRLRAAAEITQANS